MQSLQNMAYQLCIPESLMPSMQMSSNSSLQGIVDGNTSWDFESTGVPTQETRPLWDENAGNASLQYMPNINYSMSTETARAIIKCIIVPIICIFGMIGNLLTLFILSRKRLRSSCNNTEKTVHIGLLALAISDFLFCLCLLPHGLFRKEVFQYESKDFQLVFTAYGGALINMFIFMSTWLTVTLAISRYLAIVHPFKARHIIGMKGTRVCILLVCVMSFFFNIPRFFENQIDELKCYGGRVVYFKVDGYFGQKTVARTVFVWVHFTIGIFVPFTLLAFCNIALVKTLYESSQLRRRYRVPMSHVDANNRITSILVTIVLMYIFLVSPAEILLFFQQRLIDSSQNAPGELTMAVEVTNVLQTINFSCNFLLYFVLNVHFRKALWDVCCCFGRCRCQEEKSPTMSYKSALVVSRTLTTQQHMSGHIMSQQVLLSQHASTSQSTV